MSSHSARYNATVVIGGTVSSEFRTAIGSTKGAIKSVGSAVRNVEKRQRTLGRSIQTFGRMGKNVEHMRAEYQRLGGTLKRLQAQYARLGAVQKATEANLARRSALQSKLVGTSFVAAGAIGAPIAMAVKFESTMADLNKVANYTPVQLKAVRKQILHMSTVMPMAADQIGAIMTAAAQSGIAKDQIGEFTESAIKMGVAFDITGDQAGDMMAKWRTGMKLTQPQVEALADVTNYLSNNMAATAPQIADVVTRVGAYAKTAGIGSHVTAALAASMVAAGGAPEKVATGIKRMASNLTAGKSATKAQSDAMETLGFTATGMAKRMQDDAAGTIELVLSRIKQLDKAEQPAVIKELFGQESVGVIAPLLSNLDALRKSVQMAGDKTKYAGSMQAEYDQRAKTTANNLQLLKNKVVALAVNMGSILLPAVNSVAKVFGKAISTVAELAEKYPTLTKVVVGGAAALVAFRLATLASGYAFTFLKGGVLNIVGLFTRLRAVITLNTTAMEAQGGAMALLGRGITRLRNSTILATAATKARTAATMLGTAATKARTVAIAAGSKVVKLATVTTRLFGIAWKLALGPIGLVIGAVTIGAFLVIKYWKPISAFFIGLWNGIKAKAGAVWEWITQSAKATGDAVSGAWNGAIGWVKGLWDGLVGAIKSKIDWIVGKLEWVANKWRKTKNAVAGVFGGGDDEAPQKRTQIQWIQPPPAMAGAGALNGLQHGRSGPSSRHTTTNNITVHAAPGMDEKALAKHTADEIERRNRQSARSALHD